MPRQYLFGQVLIPPETRKMTPIPAARLSLSGLKVVTASLISSWFASVAGHVLSKGKILKRIGDERSVNISRRRYILFQQKAMSVFADYKQTGRLIR